MKHINLNVAQGVGDIFWIYQKFAPYYETIDFNILATNDKCPIQARSLNFLKLFPKVRNANVVEVTPEQYQAVILAKYDQRAIMESNRGQNIDYACNQPLEEGTRLEDIDPGLEVQWDVPVQTHFASMPWKDYICLYVCGTHKSPDVWSTEQWCQFVRLFYQKHGLSYPIAVIGAKFDEPVMNPIVSYLNTYNIDAKAFVEPYPGNSCYIIKNALAFIGYQSGLSIIADNFDTPQVMMYFNKLQNLPHSWPKKKNLDNKSHRTFFFRESPYEVVAQLEDFKLKKPMRQVLLTCGVGDFCAIEAMLTKEEKESVDHIFYATRQENIVRSMIEWYPAVFPNLQYQITLFDKFTAQDTLLFCVENKEKLRELPLLVNGLNFNHIEDWSLTKIGQQFFDKKRTMQNSSIVTGGVCDISKFKLPSKYVSIHPYSENALKDFRDLSIHEWRSILDWLNRNSVHGVVINKGNDPAPRSPWIIDLTNQTTMPEAIEIVKRSAAFVGASSCFSVAAAKSLPESKLFIKGHESLKTKWYKVYYAPHDSNKFIYQDLSFLGLHGPKL